jgi:hypothetical protein
VVLDEEYVAMLKLPKKCWEGCKEAGRKAGRALVIGLKTATASVAGWLGFESVANATDPITLPTTGVDLPGHITAAITAMGSVVVVVVGGFFAFMIIRKGLQWARGALRG